MEAGFRGTFVISWAQTELDGLAAAPAESLVVGASWRWTGQATRIDGPSELLSLTGEVGGSELRRHAARAVRRLVGAVLDPARSFHEIDVDDPVVEAGFVVTDGRTSFPVTQIDVAGAPQPLLMFHDNLPPKSQELWVVAVNGEATAAPTRRTAEGVICFAGGTRIATPDGPRRVETLMPGDAVQTRDNGAQEILWTGSRRMSGARLYAMPQLRPIRIREGAIGSGRPDGDLLVSPHHRMLITGRAAQALFNIDEVLVRAVDLMNDHTIGIDHQLAEVTYHHLLLPTHEVVWANGVPTESFHPADAALQDMDGEQLAALRNVCPEVGAAPEDYGAYARRNLTQSEAAILMHGHVFGH